MDKIKIAVDIFDKHAEEYQNKIMHFDLYDDTFEIFLNNIDVKNVKILDVACGPGNITRYLLDHRPDFKIVGIDLSPKMIALAKLNNPDAEFILLDIRELQKHKNKYTGIICGFGLPYLSKEEAIQFIKDVRALLDLNGVLYLSTMEDDYSKSGFKTGSSGDKIHIHYHQQDYLVQALKENGFSIVDLQRKNYPEKDGTITIDLIIIAKA
ncbi:MAG: class I SAM-dependent methyltransferase [Bacteroidota bacterium]